MLWAASGEFLERISALADAVRRTSTSAVEDLAGPLPSAASDLLQSMRTVVENVPAPTVPLDMFMEELRAKRALVHAMQEQLASFDTQLEVLERSLVPLHEWTKQLEKAQAAVTEPFRRKKD